MSFMNRRFAADKTDATGNSTLSFSVEKLESRLLLSGNVLASFIGDDLVLSGDELDNEIEITSSEGELIVRGLGDTSINGTETEFAVSTQDSGSFDGDIVVRLFDGNDQFVIQDGVAIGGSLFVGTGGGNDSIGIGEATVDGVTRAFSGAGNDQVAIQGADLQSTIIRTSRGNDTVSLSESQIAGSLTTRTGSGDDNIVVDDSEIQSRVLQNTGTGDDNFVVEQTSFQSSVAVKTRAGSDFVQFEGNDIGGRSLLRTGSGDDAALWGSDNTVAGPQRNLGGAGDDQLDIAALESGPITRGFDELTVDDAIVELRLNDPDVGAIPNAVQAQSVLGQTTEDDDTTGDDTTGDDDIIVQDEEFTVDFSQSAVNQVNDTLVIDDPVFVIQGTAVPGSSVAVAVGDDNLFDDGSVIAGADGQFEVLLVVEEDFVPIDFQVRSIDPSGIVETESSTVVLATEQSVTFDTSLGPIEIDLLGTDAPLTVSNFLDYFERGEELIVHRAPNDFVVQSGGFTFEDGEINSVVTDPPIENEFDPANSNLRGTLSVALLGGQPDSGTSGFFINTVDNAFLDNAQHTVFGQVTEESLLVVDAINDLPIFDLRDLTSNSAFGETPLRDYEPLSEELAGTVSVTAGSTIVEGQGTSFLTQIPPDNVISIDGQTYQVTSVVSDTELTVSTPVLATATDSLGFVNSVPDENNFVFVRASE